MAPKVSVCLVGLLLGISTSFAEDLPDYPFIFVTGTAHIDTPPNIVTCSLTIHAIDADAGKAQSTVDGRLKAILATLAAKGVAASDIESFNINKQILSNAYEDKDRAVEIRGYDLTRSLQFKLRQLTSLPAIETGFVGAPNVEQISCQFSRTDVEAMEADLLRKALQSAREQADKLAEPFGRHVMTAAAISREPFSSIPDAFGLGDRRELERADRMFRRSVSPETLLVPSTIPMSVSVNVLFKMD